MNSIIVEYMGAKQAREAFNKIFHKNGVYSNGFKSCACGLINGELQKDKIKLSSTKYSKEKLHEILSKQKSL